MEKNKDIKIVPHHYEKKCYFCDGYGYKIKKIPKKKSKIITCMRCEGTGKYIQTFYYIFYKGQCFGVDTLK